MLSAVEYLEKAAEYDQLAKQTKDPSNKAKYANLAECYRYLARMREKIRDTLPAARASPSISPP